MAKNIEINIKTDSGYEVLYPRVSGNNSDISTDISSQFGLNEGSSIGDVLSKIGNTGVFSGYTEKMENNYGDVWSSESYNIEIDNGSKGEKSNYLSYLGSYDDVLVFYSAYYVKDKDSEGDSFWDTQGLVVSFYNFKTKQKTERQLFLNKSISVAPHFLAAQNKILIFIWNGVWVANKDDLNFSFVEYTLSSTANRDDEWAKYFDGIYACRISKFIVWSRDLINWDVITIDSSRYLYPVVCNNYVYFISTYSSYTDLYKSTSIISQGEKVKTIVNNSHCYSMCEANGYLFITHRLTTSSSSALITSVYNLSTQEMSTCKWTGDSMKNGIVNIFYDNIQNFYYGNFEGDNPVYDTFIRWNGGATSLEITGNMSDYSTLKTLILSPVYYSLGNNMVFYSENKSPIYYSQRTYTKDYNLTNALSEVLPLGDSYRKIELTSYIGNGKYGSGNPTKITFSFNPKLVVVAQKDDAKGRHWYLVKGQTTGAFLVEASTERYIVNITWTQNGIQWYNAASAYQQLNGSNVTYFVLGIG